MKITDFHEKKILIMGLGLHGGGLGAAKFFAKMGARVIVTDLRIKKQLKESIKALKGLPIKYVLGRHQDKDFAEADLIIRNPAVPDDSPYLKIAREHDIPIDTDVGIFFDLCPAQIVGVTGTRGKSTTATLIYELLKARHKDVVLAGNIRKSVLSELPRLTQKSIVVLELSSWQLEGLPKHKKSPHIAVITTILPDHLNRYKGMRNYINAKKIIFKYQTSSDYLFLNKNDKIVSRLVGEASSKTIFFRGEDAKKYQTNLPGSHNLTNIAAAVKVAQYFNVPEASIQKALRKIAGLEGRMESVLEVNGVKYINDTCATTPDAAIAAITTVTGQLARGAKLFLIAGGADKNLDFKGLARLAAKKVRAVLLLPGTATEKLEKTIRAESGNKKIEVKRVDGMKKAVRSAAAYAKRGDTVLLSPACASFGLFRHEFERGDEFKKEARALN